ncbi:2OG-Fe(II) oxygenase [Geodermatophilus sp. SYSU D00965]
MRTARVPRSPSSCGPRSRRAAGSGSPTADSPIGRSGQDRADQQLATCVDHLDRPAPSARLDASGSALSGPLLTPQEFRQIAGFDEWMDRCHAAGQAKPTPILLRYGPGDRNALHRDLHGDLVFPLQVVVGLDTPGTDHTGGEFLVVEQRSRAQSRGHATVLPQGHALVFTTSDRPVRSARGWSAAPVRHGVSTIHTGCRHTLGLVLHDAAGPAARRPVPHGHAVGG